MEDTRSSSFVFKTSSSSFSASSSSCSRFSTSSTPKRKSLRRRTRSSSTAAFSASSTSPSVPFTKDISRPASPSSSMFSSVFHSAFSSPLVTKETPQFSNLAANPESILPEKMVEIVRSDTDESEQRITESKQQKNNKDDTQPLQMGVQDSVVKIEGKPEQNSDAALDSPLPLISISHILKGIHQSPHFLQLRKYSELTRQKLVAAWIQTFEETVEQIQGLNTRDFWVRACELWKTMEDLQGMGFNVIPIRRRLVEMTEVMIELKQSNLEILTLKIKAEDHRMERSRLESVIMSLQMRVEREGMNMGLALKEVDSMEKELPKYDALIANLAMKPFGVNI